MRKQNTKKGATVADVAAAAECSTATASMALRGKTRVPEATRQKVQVAADRLGYRRDARLSELMAHVRVGKRQQPSARLALLVSSTSEMERERSRQKNGIYQRAGELGYAIDEFPMDHRDGTVYQAGNLFRVLFNRGIQGIIVYPLEPGGSIEGANWNPFSAVDSGFSLHAPRLHQVTFHYFEGVMLAMDQLHHLGYRRIGLALRNERDASACHLWQAGFLLHNAHSGRERVRPLIRPRITRDALLRWLDRQRPDVVMTAEDRWNAPILHMIQEAGIRVPDELGYANLDIAPAYRHVAGIDQQAELIGRALVDLVVSLIHGCERGIPDHPKTVLTRGVWRQGNTVRNPAKE